MPAGLVISIDSSTTACKAIAWDRNGAPVAEGRAAYPLRQPQPGWHEQDAEDWWVGACKAVNACVATIDPVQVEAFAITHQRESFVPVDRDGRPLRNAILWNDERSRLQVLALERDYGNALHELTGKPPSMTASISKLLWLTQHEPEITARAARVLDVQAYLILRLTGEYRTSLASADPMGIIDMPKRAWAGDLIREIGWREDQFVELVEPGAVIGRVSDLAAQATGLPAGIPIIAGAGDGQCAGLGANITREGIAYLNLGTGIASGAVSDTYRCDRAFRTLNAASPGQYVMEHILRGGVYTVAWYVDKFAADLRLPGASQTPEAILEAGAATIPPGAQGLMLVPYWNSVMSPYWDPLASGVMIGWRGVHGREHFYRAILEGIAFEQRLVGDGMMAAAGQRFAEYITMGGGSQSPLWRQIMADVTGIPIVRALTAEATCLGAGIMAAAGAGWYPDIRAAAQAMTATTTRIEPDRKTAQIYEQLYREVYHPLFPAIRGVVDRLGELASSESDDDR